MLIAARAAELAVNDGYAGTGLAFLAAAVEIVEKSPAYEAALAGRAP